LRCKGDVCPKRVYSVVAKIKKHSKSARNLKSPIKVRNCSKMERKSEILLQEAQVLKQI